MAADPPLFAQLSHAYVAFIVACDNAFELHVPHRTTEHGGTAGAPWLVSTSLWFRFLRHVPVNGAITLRDLKQRAALPPNEFRMWITRFESWWGYLHVDPAAKNVRATAGGRLALLAFPKVIAETEAMWLDSFPRLYGPLTVLVEKLEGETQLPPCLSTLNYGLFTTPEAESASPPDPSPADATLPVLLAKVLYAFALAFERETLLSLALSANVLRVIPEEGVSVRDLPRLSGVAKDAMGNACKLLLKSGAVHPVTRPGARGKTLQRSAYGAQAHYLYMKAIATIEASWRRQFSARVLDELAAALPHHGELLTRMQPKPDNWRAELPSPQHLPYFPMILHRGGFPDGS